MTLKQSIYLNMVLSAFCIILIIFILIPNNGSGSKKIFFNLKDAVVEIDVENDKIDTDTVLTKLLSEQSLATIGILNGHNFYAKDDVRLLAALENESNENQLVTNLRVNAANGTSIFSNSLSPVILKVAPRFSPSSIKIGSCKKSEYFNKLVLLSSKDETTFLVAKVTESGGCSTNVNQLYINSEISNYLSGCANPKITFDALAQIYDGEVVGNNSVLCKNSIIKAAL